MTGLATVAVVARGVPGGAIEDLVSGLAPGVEVNLVIDPVGDLDPRRRWPSPAGAAAVVQLDGHRTGAVEQAAAGAGVALLGILLTERWQWFREPGPEPQPGPRGGISQVSFVAALPDIDAASFAAGYIGHRAIVETEHPGTAHYRQDIVVDRCTDAPELENTAGISQLWFPSEADFSDRYYATDQSPGIVGADIAGFLDRSGTWGVLTHEEHH